MILNDIKFSDEELVRYNRHIIIPEFGLDAQKKLKNAKVLVIGLGGLGSPVLLYLAAAGVGTIGIVDYDVVEDSNLHRQVLFGIGDIGLSKVEAATRRLRNLNPHICINAYNTKIISGNAFDIITDYDIIADGTDNFPTRYLVNDACILLGKINVYASIFQFEGQVTVFNYPNNSGERGPNYRDLFASPPPVGFVPSCAEGGVLGILPGIIGSLQALEVIKIITGIGEVLNGRLFFFDAVNFESRTFNILRNPNNPINGLNPTINTLIDYNLFCGIETTERLVREISAKELIHWQISGEEIQLIDVREPEEYNDFNISAELIPLDKILEQADKISYLKKVVIHCKMGGRSTKAVRDLEDTFGFENLFSLKGGILAYIDEYKSTKSRAS